MAFNNIHIIFNQNTGEMQTLVLNASSGNKIFNNWDEGVDKNDESPAKVLWGGADSLQLVTGSFCVVIAGRKYCA